MSFRYVEHVLWRLIDCLIFFYSVKGMMCERCAEKLKHSTYKLQANTNSHIQTFCAGANDAFLKGVTNVELNFDAERLTVTAKCDALGNNMDACDRASLLIILSSSSFLFPFPFLFSFFLFLFLFSFSSPSSSPPPLSVSISIHFADVLNHIEDAGYVTQLLS